MKTNKTAFQDYFTPKKRIGSLGITASQTLTTPNLNMDYDSFTQQLLAAANAPTARDESSARGEEIVTLSAPAVPKVESMPGGLSTAPRSNVEAKKDQVTRSTVRTAIHQMFQEDQSTSEEETEDSPTDGPIVASQSSAAREQDLDAMPLGDSVDLETEAGDARVTRWLESTTENLEEAAPREKPTANTSAMDKEQQRKERKKQTDREWREKKAQKQKAQEAKGQKSKALEAKVQKTKPQDTLPMNEEQQRKERKRISNRNWYQRKKAQEAMAPQQGAGKAATAKKVTVASKKTTNTAALKATATKAISTKVTAPTSTLSKATAPQNPALKAAVAKTTVSKVTASKTKVSKTTASSNPAPASAPKKTGSAEQSKPTTPHSRITKRKFGMFQSWNPNDVVVLSDSDSNDDEGDIVKLSASQNPKESDNLSAYPSPKPTATKGKDKQRDRSTVKNTRQVVGDRGTRLAQQRGQHGESNSQNFLASTIVQSWLAAVEEEPASRRELDHVLIPGHEKEKADNGSDTDSVLGCEEMVKDLGVSPVVEPVQGTRGGDGSAGLRHGKTRSGEKRLIHERGPATRTTLGSRTKRRRDDEDGNDTVRQSKRLKSRREKIAGRGEVVVLIDDKVDLSSYESFD